MIELINKPTELRSYLKESETDFVEQVCNFSDLSLNHNQLLLRKGAGFHLPLNGIRRFDKVIGIKSRKHQDITDPLRNAYLHKHSNRKLRLYWHAPTGQLVSFCPLDQVMHLNPRVLLWLSLFCHEQPHLKINLLHYDHHNLKAEIIDERSVIEAAPGDVLKTSLLVNLNALTGQLDLEARLFRLICENGTTLNELVKRANVKEGSDAGSFRMNLNKQLATQLHKFEKVNTGIRTLVEARPENLIDEATAWLINHKMKLAVRKAILNELANSSGATRYDVFNAITAARHVLHKEVLIEKELGVLAGKYYSDHTFQEEPTI
jgi:hypothetical protein